MYGRKPGDSIPIARSVGALSGVLLVLLAGCLARTKAQDVKIHITLAVPPDTPADSVVYLSGNLPQLGGIWRPDGHALERGADGKWRTSLSLPRGVAMEFKFTHGSWETVERDATGRDIANRSINLDSDRKLDLQVQSWASGRPAPPRKSTLTGNIRFHEQFESKILRNKRRIGVYLPPGYARDVDVRYPVLYMHDGQNCFDDATSFAGEWHADETAQRLIERGEIEPIIIVAIANSGAGRTDEYTPTKSDRYDEGGRAQEYARFLLEELKPFIDREYRTQPGRNTTGVCGSSLGGLVSLYIAMTHADQVGLCAAISPSLWWGNEALLKSIQADPGWARHCRIWFDMGTAENPARADLRDVQNTRRLAAILTRAGLQRGKDFEYLEVEGGEHNEQAWAARFDQVLRFLFGRGR